MAEERRNARPARGSGGSGRPSRPVAGGRDSSGDRRGSAPRGGRGGDGPRGQRGARTGSRPPRKGDWSRPKEEQQPRSVDQATYDGPPIPEDITGAELDRSVSGQLKGLPEKLAARVARHLAAAGLLIDSDPETAYQHTLAARARASRLAVVREATGEAAYAAGHYAEALAELEPPNG